MKPARARGSASRKSVPLLTVAVLAAAFLVTVFTVPASAQSYLVTVQLEDGTVMTLLLDLPDGATLDDVLTNPAVPGTPISLEPAGPTPPLPEPQPDDPPAEPPSGDQPPAGEPPRPGEEVPPGAPPVPGEPPAPGSGGTAPGRDPGTGGPTVIDERELDDYQGERSGSLVVRGGDPAEARRRGRRAPLRRLDGIPTIGNPGFTSVLPGPSTAVGVPNFIIRKFRVPPFLLSIYQAAGIEYGVRWEVLAAINEIETDYGRNLHVSSAGAVGWMQFLPASWRQYGVDANGDGHKDPYNPVDAIFAAARYLAAAGYADDVRGALFAYNHADWYVDSVLLRARLIAGAPADLIGSLTGLTEARFPVLARATYADDVAERELLKRVGRGENAANLVLSDESRRSIDIFARRGAAVIAVNDGVIRRIGRSRRLGHYVVLEDAYGNRYTYGHLRRVSEYHPVPRDDGAARLEVPLRAHPGHGDPAPAAPASAGSQPDRTEALPPATGPERVFAHPYLPEARAAGGLEQELDRRLRAKGHRAETYENRFSGPYGLDPSKVRLRPMKRGSRVIGGTIIGRIGLTVPGTAPHVDFSIRPAGRGAPTIDPKPILDGWQLLEQTAIYRANGENALRDGPSIGQILLLPKSLLQKRVLADSRIEIYPCGRDDVAAGVIDRRVLAALEYLAESGLSPTATSLRCGHSYRTKSGNVSEHSSGNAVDISKVNGIPILGHQDPGGIADQTVRRLLLLQGNMVPHQLISLLQIGGPTLAMADHADHIHLGYRPTGTAWRRFGYSVLRPSQWSALMSRLSVLPNPDLRTAVPPR